ncbi:hypothetical protein GGQ20_001505 [Salinibacter ruber]|nr:hypothetical protein [Salinibacter ruber]
MAGLRGTVRPLPTDWDRFTEPDLLLTYGTDQYLKPPDTAQQDRRAKLFGAGEFRGRYLFPLFSDGGYECPLECLL